MQIVAKSGAEIYTYNTVTEKYVYTNSFYLDLPYVKKGVYCTDNYICQSAEFVGSPDS